jgi:hypothetical protein
MDVRSVSRLLLRGIALTLVLASCRVPTVPPVMDIDAQSTPTISFLPIASTATPLAWPTAEIPLDQTVDTSTLTPELSLTKPRVQLTFVAKRGSLEYALYAIDIDCFEAEVPCLGEPELLFELTTRLQSPVWSPDGLSVAFVDLALNNRPDVFVADWTGQNIADITETAGSESNPTWSPNGEAIAYIYQSSTEPAQIQSLSVADRQISRLHEAAFNPVSFAWLPHSVQDAYIAQASQSDGRMRIYIVTSDGTELDAIPPSTSAITSIRDFSFAPDASAVAFAGSEQPSTNGNSSDVYVADLRDHVIKNLTGSSGNSFAPAWLPIGNWIAFQSNRTGDYDIYLIKADGSKLVNVTQSKGNDTDPAWRIIGESATR